MYRPVRRALFDPASFFERETPTRGQAAVILLALGFVAVALFPAIVVLLERLAETGIDVRDALPSVVYRTGGAEVSMSGLLFLLLVTMIAYPLVACGLYGGLFHALSWPFATRGSIGETLVAVAWGFLPQVLASLVALAAIAATLPASEGVFWRLGVTLPARTYATTLEFSPVLFAGNAVGALCTIWSGYVWTHAVAAARGLTVRRAALVVGFPVLLSLLLTVPVTEAYFRLFW